MEPRRTPSIFDPKERRLVPYYKLDFCDCFLSVLRGPVVIFFSL